MSKFPQNEWVEIDGQRVPFTKPQHYIGENNEEVRLTGEKDPLPVRSLGFSGSKNIIINKTLPPLSTFTSDFYDVGEGNCLSITVNGMNKYYDLHAQAHPFIRSDKYIVPQLYVEVAENAYPHSANFVATYKFPEEFPMRYVSFRITNKSDEEAKLSNVVLTIN